MNTLKIAKLLVVVMGVAIIVLVGVLLFYTPAQGPTLPPDNVGDAKIVHPIVSADGRLSVTSLKVGQRVTSPITVAGYVIGGHWFFEGSFPVKVVDESGAVLGRGIAQAQADWMSTGTVPFTAIVQYAPAASAEGTVVLSRDNPSGDPENDQSLSIPVAFR